MADEFKVKNGLITPNVTATGTISGSELTSSLSSGDEGGQINLNKAVTNTTLTTGVTIDVYQNKLRFFEAGGTNRGFYIDISGGGASAGTNLVGGGGSGTVTSVAQTFTGGLISVSGSPVTTTGTLALTVAGTSGGIPYFSSASTWASSAALAANALVIGGGAGAAPSTITTGTGVVTALGVNTGSSGAFVVNGGALGTPSSGTVTNLTGTASININGTVGATTRNTGAFTTINATGAILTSGQAAANQTSAGILDFYTADNATRILSWGSTGVGGKISFWTGNGGAGTTERLKIDGSGNVNVAGLTASKAVFTDASKNLTSTGTLGVDQGGTGAITLTGILKGNGTSAFTAAIANTDYVSPTGADGLLTRWIFQDTGWDYFDSGTTNTLNYTNGSHQRWAPSVGAQTLSISAWPPSDILGELLIEGVNLGASTITWPTINWIKSDGTTTTTFSQNGVVLQTSGTDWVLLWTRDSGTTIYGKVVR